jgi:resuscitation-promoting factor RpfA
MNEALPIAGAAGLGLLALAGAGMVVRRRKRRREEEEFEERQMALTEAEAEPVVPPEPAFVRPATPLHDAVPGKAPVTPLPAGFDMSKFGRHVQAAYRGPTPDNPSLSLKNRLRRASFFDQQERRAAEEAKAVAGPAERPAWMTRKSNDAEFLFRPAAKQPQPKPEYQK